MKKNILNVVLSVVIAGLFLVGASFFGKSIMDRQGNLGKGLKVNESISENTCYDSPNYFIVTKADAVIVGNDILIKQKTNEDQNIECKYKVAVGDFEILNNRRDGSDLYSYNQFFSYINDNFLILNEGTGSNRTVRVFDLEKQKDIYSDDYHGELVLQDNILIYWRATKDIPNKENCSRVDEYIKGGMGAQIETKVSLNLTDLTKKEFEEFRCLQAE